MKIQHHKLVRDNIVDIIEKDGKKASFHIASDEEYKIKLYVKLNEEIAEFKDNPCEEELADILEVIYSISKINNFDLEAVEKIRKSKLLKNGGFKKKIILENVDVGGI
ncbi:putative house-cleaning noncanonical NTP pyrophosphatase (MazG superfamily) [Methanococcus voltae PS]|uniref:House-cleaning noncanonical NTP pyrophosphatase (MazG superfamily) n=1 Tax=Methanococcus voltae PS TaxID=523842 RepID=A0ABT2EYA8_METVO|nr:nucleoside triphosphate pyrophosphohydrolase [Methanococcus voltae]MCS3922942.1 putative house-cleaning noncanonical NTP pyrophosphatase (MazG superfamily) [Methanococcus voltae PS]